MLLVHFCVLLLVVATSTSATSALQQPIQLNKQSPFDINEAYNQLMYAYSAYCPEASVTAWNCYYCTYNASLTTKGFKTTTIFKNAITNTFGYVGVQGNTVEVVFRGTQSNSLQNWITDLAAAKSTPYPNVPGAFVHAGFLDTYNVVRAQVRNAVFALVNQTKASKVIFTGHSLGGALATLAAVDIAPQIKVPSVLYNYGSPRVGNQQFMQFYQSLISTSYRIVNMAGILTNIEILSAIRVALLVLDCVVVVDYFKDMVPHLPTVSMGFHHIAEEVWWNTKTHYRICDMSGEDPTCSDSIILPNVADHLDYLQIHEGSVRYLREPSPVVVTDTDTLSGGGLAWNKGGGGSACGSSRSLFKILVSSQLPATWGSAQTTAKQKWALGPLRKTDPLLRHFPAPTPRLWGCVGAKRSNPNAQFCFALVCAVVHGYVV